MTEIMPQTTYLVGTSGVDSVYQVRSVSLYRTTYEANGVGHVQSKPHSLHIQGTEKEKWLYYWVFLVKESNISGQFRALVPCI